MIPFFILFMTYNRSKIYLEKNLKFPRIKWKLPSLEWHINLENDITLLQTIELSLSFSLFTITISILLSTQSKIEIEKEREGEEVRAVNTGIYKFWVEMDKINELMNFVCQRNPYEFSFLCFRSSFLRFCFRTFSLFFVLSLILLSSR